MHGYIDSITVPLHLPTSAFAPSVPASSKGKAKAASQAAPNQAAQYDVVANWTTDDRQRVEDMVKMASLLGYSTLVLNLSIPPTFDPSLLSFPTPLFPSLDPRTAPTGTAGLVLQLWKVTVENYSDEAVKGAGQKGWYGFANSTAPLYPASTALLGVSPTTLSSFSHVALSLAPPSAHSPTLITLDPSQSPRLAFPLKRGLISTLSRAGVVFELVVRGVTRQDEPGDAPGDAGKRRRNWIAGAREVVRATEAKGVVISSGARSAAEMRGSEDLVNLCSLIGMPPSQAKAALTVNPNRAIMRGLSMRQTYRGVISNPVLREANPSAPTASARQADGASPLGQGGTEHGVGSSGTISKKRSSTATTATMNGSTPDEIGGSGTAAGTRDAPTKGTQQQQKKKRKL